MNRRQFLKSSLAGVGAAALAGTCYSFFEAGWIQVSETTLPVAGLSPAFHGTRVAFLTDLHHGPYTDLAYVQNIVRTTNLLRPDVVVLGGDYSLRDAKYIAPCIDMLGNLRARMGVVGVLGNHDYRHGEAQTRTALAAAKITELTNDSIVFEERGERFVVAGVDDFWLGRPSLPQALRNARRDDSVLLVSHNPDFCETLSDRRVKLVLSGHTHGGQIVFPGATAPFVPSRYGAKYLRGVVQAPETTVLVSRGLGTSLLPARVGSRPEINVVTICS